MITLLLSCVVMPLMQESRPNAKVAWQRFRLDNGILVSVLHVKDAARQSSFSFLPLGLLNDAKDRAQFSHLIEHMLIRSTDPARLGIDGIMLNGETMGSTMRLESIAVPAKWKEALGRHVRWLSVKTIDATGMSKEKKNISAEVDNTLRRGYTHKWALAAWNQVIRHGKTHARVVGDVAAANQAQVVALLPQALEFGKIRVYCVGPIPAEEIKKLLVASFPAPTKEKAGREKAGKTSATARKKQPLPARKTRATWDLARAQLMLWFPLAGKKADEYLAAEVMARNINMNLMAARKLKSLGVIAMASVERLPDAAGVPRVSVLLSASCKADSDALVIEEHMLKAVSGLTKVSLGFTLMNVKMQGVALPDFTSWRNRLRGRAAELFEAQVALQVAYRELNSGLDSQEYAKAIGLLDKDRVIELYAAWMQPKQAHSLFLTPKKR